MFTSCAWHDLLMPFDGLSLAYTSHLKMVMNSKIEKVPRGIRGEKSSKDMASSSNLVSTIGAQASPLIGRNQVSWRVSVPCWHATPVANAPWKPLIIGEGSSSVSRSWNWWKVWLVVKSLLVKDQNVILHSWERYFILLNNIPVSTIKLPEWRFQAFREVSLFELLTEKSSGPQNKTSIRGASPGVSYKLREKTP